MCRASTTRPARKRWIHWVIFKVVESTRSGRLLYLAEGRSCSCWLRNARDSFSIETLICCSTRIVLCLRSLPVPKRRKSLSTKRSCRIHIGRGKLRLLRHDQCSGNLGAVSSKMGDEFETITGKPKLSSKALRNKTLLAKSDRERQGLGRRLLRIN